MARKAPTGYGDGYSVVVAYADSVEEILRLWPEATNIGVLSHDVDEYHFTSRFPKPDWFEEEAPVEIGLYWGSFFDLMDEVGMNSQYSEFEERLKSGLKKEFGKDIKIEWLD